MNEFSTFTSSSTTIRSYSNISESLETIKSNLTDAFDRTLNSSIYESLVKNKKHKKLRIEKAKFKTELCVNFEKDGFCKYEDKCRFAHGNEELNSEIKLKNYKTKPCESFTSKGYCKYGKKCLFQHEQSSKSHYYWMKGILDQEITRFTPLKLNSWNRLPIFHQLHMKNLCTLSITANFLYKIFEREEYLMLLN